MEEAKQNMEGQPEEGRQEEIAAANVNGENVVETKSAGGPAGGDGGAAPDTFAEAGGRKVSIEALQQVYNARERNDVLKFPAAEIDEYGGERCLIIYIPDVESGVKGILPESKAGLQKNESLELLLRDPYLRVIPERVNREEGYCILNREIAERIEAARAWNRIEEGSEAEAMVLGVRRRQKELVLDVDGLLAVMPVKELSHYYVQEIDYRRGETLRVKVLKKKETAVEKNGRKDVRRRLVVSKRALEFNPWSVENHIPKVGMPYPGKIIYIGPRYFHVLLRNGIEVLTKQPSINYKGWDYLKVGSDVTVYIVHVDREKQRAYGNFNKREVAGDIKRYARRARKK